MKNTFQDKSSYLTGVVIGLLLFLSLGAAAHKSLIGPNTATTTDAVVRWTDANSSGVKNSLVTIDDTGKVTAPGGFETPGDFVANTLIINLSEGYVKMEVVGDTTNLVHVADADFLDEATITNGLNRVIQGTGPLAATSVTDALATKAAPALSGVGSESGNIGATMPAGATDAVNMSIASATNDVSGTFTIPHATNGVANTHLVHVRWFSNSSGSDQTLAVPSGWRTNLYSAIPTKITNAWITKMVVETWSTTADAATQTNAFVSFEYFH